MVDATFALNLVETVGILIGIAIAIFQLREFNIKSACAPEMILLEKIRKNTFSYEKILQLNGSTTPITKRRPKNTPLKKRGGGGHTFIREYQSIQQKEPEKRSSTIRFQSKT